VGTLQWIVDGYAVALASLLLTGGTLGDLYGHKRVVLVGFALFGAFAESPNSVSYFLAGLHATPLIGAGLWVVGILLTGILVGRPTD
jgi:DHA2 family methylenomycin A resistance protein-like MFS transporter